jgi:hypothetical protein
MILNLYKSLSSAFLSTDKKYSVEHIAADSLFTHQSYRLGKEADKDKYLFLRILKEVLFKSFIKFKYYKFWKLPPCVSRAIDDPTTLQTPNTVAPFDFASSIAARVSAVSPLCEIAITISS